MNEEFETGKAWSAQLPHGGIISLLLLSFSVAAALVFLPLKSLVIIGLVFAAIGALITSVKWPEVFVVLAIWSQFLKSLFIPGASIGDFGLTPYMVFSLIAIVGFFFQIVIGQRRLILPGGFIFLALFFAFRTLSLLLVPDLDTAIGAYGRNTLDMIVMLILVQMLIASRGFKRLMLALLFQATVMTFWGILAGLQLEISEINRNALLFWQQFQKNDFAAYLAVVLMLAVSTTVTSRNTLVKSVALSLVGLVPIAWLFTFSRGGFLAILAALIIFISLERNKAILLRTGQIALLLILAGASIVALTPGNARQLAVDGLRSLIGVQTEHLRHTQTIDFRINLLLSGTETFLDHPALGVGYNQWQFYSPLTNFEIDRQTGEEIAQGSSIHNRYLLIAVNSGILALISYLMFVASTLFSAIHARKDATTSLKTYLNGLIAAALGIQVALLFAPTALWEWPILGLVSGMTNLIYIESRGALPRQQSFRFIVREKQPHIIESASSRTGSVEHE